MNLKDQVVSKVEIIFKPVSIVHRMIRDKEDKTCVEGANYIADRCIGQIRICLTEEEMQIIDDVILGVARRKNRANKELI